MAEFKGEQFDLPDKINQRRVNKLGVLQHQMTAAQRSGDEELKSQLISDSMVLVDGLVTMCLRPEDVDRFDALCDEHGVTDEEQMSFVAETIAEYAGRPTSRPSVSSDGPPSTAPSSVADSFSQVATRLEQQQRPDLALIVMETQAARSA